MTGAQFDLDGARRIVRSVRTVEGGLQRLGSTQPIQSGGGVGGRWFPALNDSGSTIEAASCVEVMPTAGKDFPKYTIQAPAEFARYWPVCGQKEFAGGVEGLISWDAVATLRLDGAATAGDIIGPSSSSGGALVADGYGFEVLYLVDDDEYAVCHQTQVNSIRFDSGSGGVAAGSSASVAVYSDDDATDLGWLVDVFNYGDVDVPPNFITTAEAVGEQWLAVMPGFVAYLGKTDAAIDKDDAGTVSIWTGSNTAPTDSTVNITGCENKFADLAITKWVVVLDGVYGVDGPIIIAGEC